MRIHDKRFYLPENVTIYKRVLQGEFVYEDNAIAGRQVLSGKHNYSEGFNRATRELTEERVRVRSSISSRSVNKNLKRQGWQRKRKKANEKMSPSIVWIHFSH